MRSRSCNNPTPSFGGQDCTSLGPQIEQRNCIKVSCPGKWYYNVHVIHQLFTTETWHRHTIILTYLYSFQNNVPVGAGPAGLSARGRVGVVSRHGRDNVPLLNQESNLVLTKNKKHNCAICMFALVC